MSSVSSQSVALSFLAGFAACASSIALYFSFPRLQLESVEKRRLRELLNTSNDVNDPVSLLNGTSGKNGLVSSKDASSQSASKEATECLMKEQLSRNVQFFGENGQQRLQNAFIVVVGLGGVGSHAVHMLVRSGVRRIRIIDFDQVTLSSLNRHAVATREDVGTPKATALARHLLEFAPWCQIDVRVAMFSADHADELLCGNPDYILDCIDDIKTKIDLLSSCCEKKLRVISSMGAGAKADPTRIHIANLDDVVEDPLASRIRWQLGKAKYGASIRKVEAIYCSEKPHMKLLPLELSNENEKPSDFGAMPDFRVRVIPVLGMMPALFGMAMASRVACNLAEKPFLPSGIPPLTVGVCNRLHQRFRTRAMNMYGASHQQDLLDLEDMDFLVIQWKKRCAISHERWKRSGIEIAQWRFDKPVDIGNVVLVKKKYAQQLDEMAKNEILPTPEAFGITEEHFRCIESKLKQISQWNPRPKTPEALFD